MTFPYLIAGIILSVMASIATLILCIISLASGKQRNGLILGVTFIMSIVVSVLVVMQTVQQGREKVKSGIAWLNGLSAKNNTTWNSADAKKDTYYAFISEGNKDTIASSFYNARENDTYYTPLVFPYRFVSHDMNMNFATLEIMRGEKSIRTADSCFDQLQCISYFSFDEKLLLAKRDNKEFRHRNRSSKTKNLREYSFILFDFSTGKCSVFPSEEQLMEEAKKQGYHGKDYMEMSTTHYFYYSATEGD